MQGHNFKAESKLLVFFLYFAIAVALSLIFFTIGSRNIAQYQQGFMDYFVCEAFGVDPDNPCVFEVDRRGDQAFTIASYAMYALGPYVTLVYIVPVDKVKEKWRVLKHISPQTHSQHVQGAKLSTVESQV